MVMSKVWATSVLKYSKFYLKHHIDVNSQLSSLTIDSEEDEYDDGSIDDAISAYEGPAASLPSQTPPPYVASTGRTGVYMVTNGRRTGIFSTW